MQKNCYLLGLFLALIFVFIPARTIPLNSYEPVADDLIMNNNEHRRQIFYFDRMPSKSSSSNPKKLIIHIGNEHTYPHEHDRSILFARRAKAIVKGDPREFMG
ncbi:hypothetical protein I4U23_020321 [Adineta vaga]|nr:hypothetical protein I4U23_020321 [Adineta vaga]